MRAKVSNRVGMRSSVPFSRSSASSAAVLLGTAGETLDEVPYPVKMEPNLVVEFYSR